MAMDASSVQDDIEAVVPYSMHVSSRYLDLTRQKLELTRLPRECEGQECEQWALGTPKSVLEPLLDHWLDTYDWRAEEAHFNASLPQFRTTLSVASQSPLRIHFVHKRSPNPNAIPLLYCHSWPSSFIEAQRIIDALAKPHSADEQAFHVIVPSIPGFGFSDASVDTEFGVWGTAKVLGELMKRLGYEGFVACGSDWGFDVCRALSMEYPRRCRAVHTTNPVFNEPSIRQSPSAWMKWNIAKLTRAKVPALSFGYTSSDIAISPPTAKALRPLGPTLHRLYSLRPQTLAFSLCDSPMGLLAGLLDMIHSRGLDRPVVALKPRPLSLDKQDLKGTGASHERMPSDETVMPEKSGQSESGAWSASDVLNWTMMMWLPGAEAGLRWLRRAHVETTAPSWNVYCPVPLGITSFRRHGDTGISSPPMWGSTLWSVVWVKRHQDIAEIAAWERPDVLVMDLRAYFGQLLQEGMRAKFPVAGA